MKIYLDTSALNRIFDDQSQPRIYMEATSMLIILMLIESQSIELTSSDVLIFENDNNPYEERRSFLSSIFKKAGHIQAINDSILLIAQEIEKYKIKGLDALHIACAEKLEVDYFITCDDKIMKRYKGSIKVQGPIDFVINILREEENNDK